MEKKRKVAWLSRHEMTAEQTADLAKTLGCELGGLEIETINHTWAASENVMSDVSANSDTWLELAHGPSPYDVICGVFPPVALEAMCCSLPHVYTPVSRARPDLRQGDEPIPFEHLRWSNVVSAHYFKQALRSVAESHDHVRRDGAAQFAEDMLHGHPKELSF